MAKRLYHPGRRKRRVIMRERAFAIAFGINPDERHVKFPAELRELLEALVDVDAAYDGSANMDCCIVAGEKALEKSTTHVSGKISELKGKGFVRFENFSGGARLVIDDNILEALVKLEKYELMIDTTTRIEDIGAEMNEENLASLAILKSDNVYVPHTDAQLDMQMRNTVKPIVDERRADRAAKKEAKKILEKVGGFAAVVVFAGSMFAGSADAADRGGTVGLGLIQQQVDNTLHIPHPQQLSLIKVL